MYKVYEQVKCVLIVNCLFGIFPITNCFGDSCKKLKFQLFSWCQVYSVLHNISVLAVSLLTEEYIHHLHFKRLTREIQIEYTIWICILYETCTKFILVLVKIEAFDTEREQIKHLKSKNYVALIVYLLQICLCITTIYEKFQPDEGFIKWTKCFVRLLFSYMSSVRSVAVLPYVITLYALADRFQSVNSDLKETFLKQLPTVEKLLEVERHRIRHLRLCCISNELITCFSLLLTTFFALIYVDMMVKVGVMVIYKDNALILDTQLFFNNAFLLYITIHASQNIQNKSSHILYTLIDQPLCNKSDQFYSLMKQFLLQVKTSSVKVTAGRYFSIDKKTILGIVGSMAGFLVAIIQLGPTYIQRSAEGNYNQPSTANFSDTTQQSYI